MKLFGKKLVTVNRKPNSDIRKPKTGNRTATGHRLPATGRRSMRGDTIVEVMAAITIIGLALATAYALSNRSYRTAQTSVERSQALSMAQGQVEFLKDLKLEGSIGTTLAAYAGGSGFCFNYSDGSVIAADPASSYCKTSIDPLFDLVINYSGAGGTPPGVYSVNTSWDKLGGGRNQLTVYYKAGN